MSRVAQCSSTRKQLNGKSHCYKVAVPIRNGLGSNNNDSSILENEFTSQVFEHPQSSTCNYYGSSWFCKGRCYLSSNSFSWSCDQCKFFRKRFFKDLWLYRGIHTRCERWTPKGRDIYPNLKQKTVAPIFKVEQYERGFESWGVSYWSGGWCIMGRMSVWWRRASDLFGPKLIRPEKPSQAWRIDRRRKRMMFPEFLDYIYVIQPHFHSWKDNETVVKQIHSLLSPVS